MAPELLSEEPYEPYGADIWALGILLYTFLHGTPPFKKEDPSKLKASIQAAEFGLSNSLSREAADLI